MYYYYYYIIFMCCNTIFTTRLNKYSDAPSKYFSEASVSRWSAGGIEASITDRIRWKEDVVKRD